MKNKWWDGKSNNLLRHDCCDKIYNNNSRLLIKILLLWKLWKSNMLDDSFFLGNHYGDYFFNRLIILYLLVNSSSTVIYFLRQNDRDYYSLGMWLGTRLLRHASPSCEARPCSAVTYPSWLVQGSTHSGPEKSQDFLNALPLTITWPKLI